MNFIKISYDSDENGKNSRQKYINLDNVFDYWAYTDFGYHCIAFKSIDGYTLNVMFLDKARRDSTLDAINKIIECKVLEVE